MKCVHRRSGEPCTEDARWLVTLAPTKTCGCPGGEAALCDKHMAKRLDGTRGTVYCEMCNRRNIPRFENLQSVERL